MLFQAFISPPTLAWAAASPVRVSPFFGRSSEGLGCCGVRSQHIGNTLVSRHRLHAARLFHLPAAQPHFRHDIMNLVSFEFVAADLIETVIQIVYPIIHLL